MLESLQRVEALLADANLGVWQVHVPTGVMKANAVIGRLLGHDQHQLGQSPERTRWVRRIHRRDRRGAVAQLRRMAAGESTGYVADYRIRVAGGEWRTIRCHVQVAERDAAGLPLWLMGIVRDVSAEVELSRRMHAIFDRPFQFIGLLTREGVVIESSRNATLRTAQEADALVGKYLWETPLFAHSAALRAQVRQGIASAACGEVVRFELCHPNAAGVTVTQDFTLTPLRDEDGTVLNIIPEGRDISDVVRTREALRMSEERLNTATRTVNIGLWDWNARTEEMWCHDQWHRMLGIERPAGVSHGLGLVRELTHADDLRRLAAGMKELMAGRIPEVGIECRLRHADGNWRWMLLRARASVHDETGAVVRIAGVQVDITERRELEQHLASAQRLEAIGQLAAGVAHEINTPIQYVSDSVQFVRDGMRELRTEIEQLRAALPQSLESEDQRYLRENIPPALDRAVDGLNRLTEIVRSMKEFSHPGREHKEPADLNRAIAATLVVARNEYKYVADLETDFGDLPPVSCHVAQINQVVLNLVVNAAHAVADVVRDTAAKGRITVRTHQDGNQAVISVTDTGAGIPEEVRDRVFEPFFTTKEVGKGTGQGLAIAHNVVVTRHCGQLAFQTELGVGTTFRVRLPITAAEPVESFEATERVA